METQHNTLFVAFASQKGGVGKSTFTSLVASAMHYRLGYNVAVFDCDFPQYSLVQMRARDMKTVMENEAFKKMAHRQFTALNKKAYPILQQKAETVLEAAQEFIASWSQYSIGSMVILHHISIAGNLLAALKPWEGDSACSFIPGKVASAFSFCAAVHPA
ncbi:MAG: ParA family protein [Sphingobacteriales bacterium]|nr:MAG: ParA family protein [Sphingobacteriales bacterium]